MLTMIVICITSDFGSLASTGAGLEDKDIEDYLVLHYCFSLTLPCDCFKPMSVSVPRPSLQ